MAQLNPPPIQLEKSASAPIEPKVRNRRNTTGGVSRSNSSRKPRKKRKKVTTPTTTRDRQRSIPRKLGPRDVGRIKYKQGTKYEDDSPADFLKEKIHKHARGSSFLARKKKNPVPHAPTVDQV